MADAEDGQQILCLTAAVLGGFGLVVLAGLAAAKLRGRSARALVTKYLAWFLIIPPILVPLVYSRWIFQGVVLLISLQCMREFSRVTGLWADRTMMAACYLLIAAVYVPVLGGWYALHQCAPAIVLGLLVLLPVVRGRYERMLQEVSLSVLGVLYFGWFLSHLAYLRNCRFGVAAAFFLMVLVECNDALAYLWGQWLGRHQLSPRISPNKTVEGAACAAACVLLAGYALRGMIPGGGAAAAVLLAGAIAVLGVMGDLVISFIKRDVAVKDMGRSIPGHGGFLDRCDSIILAAPVFFHATRGLYGA
jgi:phosphatidate cytidylyltransferase